MLPKHGALPAGVASLYISPEARLVPEDETVVVRVDVRQIEGRDGQSKASFLATCVVIGRAGDGGEAIVLEQWTDLRLSDLYVDNSLPSTLDLVEPSSRDEAAFRTALREASWAIGTTCPQVAIRSGIQWHMMPREKRHDVQAEMLKSLGEERPIKRNKHSMDDPNNPKKERVGKPFIQGTHVPTISVTHTDLVCAMALAASNHPAAGVDLAPIPLAANKYHIRELMVRRMAEIQRLQSAGDTEEMAASRIWAAFEAAYKADNSIPFDNMDILPYQLSYEHAHLLQIVERGRPESGALKVLTFPTKWTLGGDLMAAVIVGTETLLPPLIPSVLVAPADIGRRRDDRSGPAPRRSKRSRRPPQSPPLLAARAPSFMLQLCGVRGARHAGPRSWPRWPAVDVRRRDERSGPRRAGSSLAAAPRCQPSSATRLTVKFIVCTVLLTATHWLQCIAPPERARGQSSLTMSRTMYGKLASVSPEMASAASASTVSGPCRPAPPAGPLVPGGMFSMRAW